MPNIPMKPIMPVKPIIPIKPQASVSKPSSSPIAVNPKRSFSGIITLKGGLKKEHTIEVADRSDEPTQLLPYQFHCNTCNYEGKVKDYSEALFLAQRHVGL